MRTASLAVVLAFLASASPAGNDPEPPPADRQKLLLEPSLPNVGLPPLGKAARLAPDLKGTDPKAYADKAKANSPVRKAVRAAQVALWACSHETAPVPLQADVVAVRRQWKLDPRALRLRYAIPDGRDADNRLKNEAAETSKQLSRLVGHLEDVLDELEETSAAAVKEGPRWAAQVALLRLWVSLRIAALEEHQAALGQIRKEFPTYDPKKHAAWQLTPGDGLVDSVSKKHLEQARSFAAQIARAHKNTGWDKLAQKAIEAKLGARWVAVE